MMGFVETLHACIGPPTTHCDPALGDDQRVTSNVLIPNQTGADPQITSWNANQEP